MLSDLENRTSRRIPGNLLASTRASARTTRARQQYAPPMLSLNCPGCRKSAWSRASPGRARRARRPTPREWKLDRSAARGRHPGAIGRAQQCVSCRALYERAGEARSTCSLVPPGTAAHYSKALGIVTTQVLSGARRPRQAPGSARGPRPVCVGVFEMCSDDLA